MCVTFSNFIGFLQGRSIISIYFSRSLFYVIVFFFNVVWPTELIDITEVEWCNSKQ